MSVSGVEEPDYESMSPGDWRDWLRKHPDHCLVINAPDGVHTIEYDEETGEGVTFWAYGSQGYDDDGTQAVLEEVAGDSEGLQVQTKEETYGKGSQSVGGDGE